MMRAAIKVMCETGTVGSKSVAALEEPTELGQKKPDQSVVR
jgi:hypothetical protein